MADILGPHRHGGGGGGADLFSELAENPEMTSFWSIILGNTKGIESKTWSKKGRFQAFGWVRKWSPFGAPQWEILRHFVKKVVRHGGRSNFWMESKSSTSPHDEPLFWRNALVFPTMALQKVTIFGPTQKLEIVPFLIKFLTTSP